MRVITLLYILYKDIYVCARESKSLIDVVYIFVFTNRGSLIIYLSPTSTKNKKGELTPFLTEFLQFFQILRQHCFH